MSKFECKVCGYLYDEAFGERTEGIEAGTLFDSFGDDWRCPVCDGKKCDFVKVEDDGEDSLFE